MGIPAEKRIRIIKLMVVCGCLLMIAACASQRQLLPENLPDTLGIAITTIGGLTSPYEDIITGTFTRQLKLHNQVSDRHYMLVTPQDSTDVFHVQIIRVRLSNRKKQGLFLVADLFGLFVMPNIMKSLDSDLTGRFLLLPWDRVHYGIIYYDGAGGASKEVFRTAGRVPFFEGPEHQQRRVSLGFSTNLIEFLRNTETQTSP